MRSQIMFIALAGLEEQSVWVLPYPLYQPCQKKFGFMESGVPQGGVIAPTADLLLKEGAVFGTMKLRYSFDQSLLY